MITLNRENLLTAFNAQPYSNWGSEDDALLSDSEPIDNQHRVLAINLEEEADRWQPIPCLPELADDPRLPNWFLDGAVSSLEVAGTARDEHGYPRVIRAGQLGVGATCRLPNIPNHKKFWRFVALNASGYGHQQLAPLMADLRGAFIPHELFAWQPNDDKEKETAFDLMNVRTLVRNSTRDEMLIREQALVDEIAAPIYVDGRYVDHAPIRDAFLAVGIIKSQRARYLTQRPLEVLYSLQQGERTPAFLIERQRGNSGSTTNHIVTFYIRLTSPAIVGPGSGLARIELSVRYFQHPTTDSILLNAITADLVRLRSHDNTYTRGAVTIEPIRLIERELHLIFRDGQMAAMDTLQLLQKNQGN